MAMRPGFFAWFDRQQVMRVFLYYAILGAVVLLLRQVAPGLPGVFSSDYFTATLSEFSGRERLTAAPPDEQVFAPMRIAGTAILMMTGAVLLMLPVAWVHILTRSRKGFSQSMVQTLIILPLVVAGVLTVVAHSLALAFALGGVVGAVSFRNRLADPKDAIYIFVAMSVGIAAGVQVLSVAAAISLFFNLVALVAWWFDFGRMPATLEAAVAERRLHRVKASRGEGAPAAATSRAEFLNVLDRQLLKSMTPEQLQALSERAAERRRKALGRDEQQTAEAEAKPRFDATMRVRMPVQEAPTIRRAVEAVLASQTKRWVEERAGPDGGDPNSLLVSYRVRFAKNIPSPLVVEAARRAALPHPVTIELGDP